MNTEVMKVTPALAEKWLTETEKIEGIRNRSIADGKVALYAENMVRGNWEISHQGIALYKTRDNLVGVLDGQHRLWAVIKASVPIIMQVTHYSGGGIEDAVEIMKTFDRGQTRTIGHVLQIESKVTAPGTRGAIARQLLAFLRGGGSSDQSVIRKITDADIIDAVHRYERSLDWFCSLRRSRKGGNRFLSAPIAAALVYVHSIPQHEEVAVLVGNQLSGGEGLYQGDPALVFRDWILKEDHENLLRRPETRMKLMRVTFKAIQKAAQRNKVGILKDDMSGFEFFRSAKEKN